MRQLFGQRLILARPADGQVLALGLECGGLVAISRDRQLVGDALGQVARQGGALLQCNAGNRNQRQNVGGAHTRVGTLMVPHIDRFGRLSDALESGLDDRLGRSDERDDRAVGRLAGIDVQHLDATRTFDGRDDPPDRLLIAPLAEIGDALNDSLLHSYDFFDSMIQNATTAIGPAPYSTNITVFRQKKARIVRKITTNSADS